MFILKFFKGLKSQKKPLKPYSIQEIPSQISEIQVIDVRDAEENPDKGQINFETASVAIENINENQPKTLTLIKKEKILIRKSKPGSYIDVNNAESWRNLQKKNKGKHVSIEPLKVKFKEKKNKKPAFIIKTQGKKKEKKTESTIFDKIDKILAKSTVNRENNDEKTFIELMNKNMRKSKSLIPQKKDNNYLRKFFGEKNKKTKEIAVLKVSEVKKTNKSLIQQNNSSVDLEENSMRIVEWKEANSLQEIKNTVFWWFLQNFYCFSFRSFKKIMRKSPK